MIQRLSKYAVIVFCLLGLVIILTSIVAYRNLKKDKEYNAMLNRYQGNHILNGVYLDSNCSPEDIIVIDITSYLHKVSDTGSVLCQVAEPDEKDNYHRYLSATKEDYDGHTYWLYAGKNAGYLFYENSGSLVIVNLSEELESS